VSLILYEKFGLGNKRSIPYTTPGEVREMKEERVLPESGQ